jgi:hypothetical protein
MSVDHLCSGSCSVRDVDSPLGPSITDFEYASYRLETSRIASYPAVSSTIASSEKMSEPVPEMCQEGKTMQRSVVSQVNNIYQMLVIKLSYQAVRNRDAYVHVALGAVAAHARHVVVHVAVIHM